VKVMRMLRWARRQGVVSLVVIVVGVLSLRSAIADWNDVPTGSMKPTILVGDRIFVNKLAYDLKVPFTDLRLATWGGPARGDIVTCWSPADGARLVKRVVGVPGDVVAMRGGHLSINGATLAYRPATDPDLIASLGKAARGKDLFIEQLPDHPHFVAYERGGGNARDFGPVTVPAGRYFLMGDNRDHSADSRYFGCVGRDAILGRVQGTVWSFDLENHYRPRWSRFGADMS
jgi:signal peptidase I